MIPASELRTGNWVNYKSHLGLEPIEVESINHLGINLIGEVEYIVVAEASIVPDLYFEDIEPISLNESILLKCGFIEQNFDGLTWLEHPGDHSPFTFFTGDKNGILEVVVEFHGEEMKRVKYLHELQNLFFYLTGEDLEVAI